jgi:LysM repeat protein
VVNAPNVVSVDSNIYVVKSGDVLGKIASANRTTVSAIKSLNGLTTDKINVGQKLKLPPKPVTATEVPPLITDPAVPGTAPVR